MKLSSKESNLIGAAGNLGMYASGIPMGLLVDVNGPRVATLGGALALAVGYYPIHLAYKTGPGSLGIPFLLFFSFLTGLGSCAAFLAALKAAASNFPHHRGTATSFPLAGFGLSAFFFSALSNIAFKDDIGQFLLLLSLGTAVMILVSSVFIRIVPASASYSSLSHQEPRGHEAPRRMHGVNPAERRSLYEPDEPGTQSTAPQRPPTNEPPLCDPSNAGSVGYQIDADEASPLVSSSNSPRESGDTFCEGHLPAEIGCDSHYLDVRGLALLSKVEFWQLFLTMGLLSGIGLMTINNIGNNAFALWKHYDDSVESKFIVQQQVMQVSTLSICSCIGRLSSGIGSDVLVKKLHMSRFWCLFFSAALFTITQLAGMTISNPHHLVAISAFTGLAYGFLFGVFPSLVAHTFGIGGLSQNWGIMTLAPVFSANIFNLLYGTIYDQHSIVSPEGERDCSDGLKCYQAAYYLTFFSGVAGGIVCLWSIWQEKRVHGGIIPGKVEHQRLA
jgi:MFS family permease